MSTPYNSSDQGGVLAQICCGVTVADGIDIVQPWAVDVSSGVESSPGVKDLKKVDDFIRATREGDELHNEFWL